MGARFISYLAEGGRNIDALFKLMDIELFHRAALGRWPGVASLVASMENFPDASQSVAWRKSPLKVTSISAKTGA
jgi:hypothetical protein